MKTALLPFPAPTKRLWRLVGRNFRVWKKLLLPSIIVHLIEPVIFLVGFGLGVGALVGEINGDSYLQFIAAGMVGYGVMNSASFEALYSTFTRMHVQRTWEAILNAPMTLDDVLLGEWMWAAIKGVMAGAAMLLLLVVLGLATMPHALLALPCIALTALAFSGAALMVNAVARGYDFFSYYFTLFVTPMMMLSGAFFPVKQLPSFLQTASDFLPLSHTVQLLRPLLGGDFPPHPFLNIAVLGAYAVVGLWVAVLLTRKRLLQ